MPERFVIHLRTVGVVSVHAYTCVTLRLSHRRRLVTVAVEFSNRKVRGFRKLIAVIKTLPPHGMRPYKLNILDIKSYAHNRHSTAIDVHDDTGGGGYLYRVRSYQGKNHKMRTRHWFTRGERSISRIARMMTALLNFLCLWSFSLLSRHAKKSWSLPTLYRWYK